jgi:hypothetical protein
MFLHDHEVKKAPMYCTLMREICYGGWTKSMGFVDEDKAIKPSCHKWVGVYINDQKTNQIKEVHDCNEQWNTDLLQQICQEVYQHAAATESVRNHVADGNMTSRVIQSFFMQLAAAAGQNLEVPKFEPPKELVSKSTQEGTVSK